MKIDELKVNSYGKLKNKDIKFKDGINIIYGENEHGKSTLLNFIVNMFYGTSKNKKGKIMSDFDKYKPWDTEEFSGKIKYTLDNGENYEVFREFSKKNPKIYDENMEDVSKEYSIDKNTGSQFFYEQTKVDEQAFTSTVVSYQNEVELDNQTQNILLQKIANTSSTGVDNISYKKAFDKLNKKQLDEIGTTRSQGKPINVAIREIENLTSINESLRRYENYKYEIEDKKYALQNDIFKLNNQYEFANKINFIKQQQKVEEEKLKYGENKIDDIESKIQKLIDEKENVESNKITKRNADIKKFNLTPYIIALVLGILLSVVSFVVIKNIIISIACILIGVIICVIGIGKNNKIKAQNSANDKANNEVIQNNRDIEKKIYEINAQIELLEKSQKEQVNEVEKIKNELLKKINNEKEKLKNAMFDWNDETGFKLKSFIPGQSPYQIAKQAGFEVPEDTKVIVVYEEGIGRDYPFSKEKLSPVLTYYIVNDYEEALDKAERLLEFGGLGHTAVIHSEDREKILEFSEKMKAGRIIVNSPSTHGGIGDIYNTNMPSLTLGCGSFGGNSTTANVSSVNLINIKRVARRRVNMQWFKVPEKIYFEAGSIAYLEKMPDIERAFIVTDPGMVKFGYVDKILYHIRKRANHVHCEIFSEVESDPSFETVNRGLELMNNFKPDVIIALGGGSAIDAAKGMWLFYEHPDADAEGLKLKFMDIRKRTYKFPKLGVKAKMVAIPTTSGTGSEVTSFAVLTDKVKNKKYPLADYELTPDVAIIDPTFVMSVPAAVTADTGLDVLTHAIEAYVSIMATDYTDALAMKAIQMVFEYLPKSYKGANTAEGKEAREKMHNASCIAGMAFANAFLGVNHSLAHKLGSEFHIPHGRANAILLPHVIEYNATMPSKFAAFPKYKSFVADKKYAEIAKALGLKANTTEEGVKSLVEAVRNLMKELNMPMTVQACGIEEETYFAAIERLALDAFDDQCTPANPRLPLVSELVQIYKDIYKAKSPIKKEEKKIAEQNA